MRRLEAWTGRTRDGSESSESPATAGLSFHAPKRTRTSTGQLPHKALNLARLPIPPPARDSGDEHSGRGPIATVALIPSERPATFTNTCSTETRVAKGDPGGSDQAPAGDLRLH